MSGFVRHSARVTIAKAEAPQVFRLSDMDVEEVSLVDRAANKKKFLVVKRSDQMPTEVQADGKGGFTASGGTNKGAPPPPAKDPKKDPKKPDPTAKAGGMEVPPGFKEAIAPIIDKATAQLEALSEAVSGSKAADVPDDGTMPGVPAEFADGVTGVMNLLDRACSMWPAQAADPEDDPTQGGDSGVDESTEGAAPAEMQMRLALDNMTKVFVGKRMSKALVQKIGAKMSKDRLTRLQQAVAQLSSLVNEVAGEPATPPAAAGAPAVGKGGKTAAVVAPAAKAIDPVLAALGKQIEELVGSVGQLAGVVKGQGETLTAIGKSRGAPSGGVVETITKGAAPKDPWASDMAAPLPREGTAKNESFFDE